MVPPAGQGTGPPAVQVRAKPTARRLTCVCGPGRRNGRVIAAITVSDNAFKITAGGTITQIIDSSGAGDEQLIEANSIAVDQAENVYATGRQAAAFKITHGGVVTQIIDSSGDGQGNELYSATDVAVDSGGIAYVALGRAFAGSQISSATRTQL